MVAFAPKTKSQIWLQTSCSICSKTKCQIWRLLLSFYREALMSTFNTAYPSGDMSQRTTLPDTTATSTISSTHSTSCSRKDFHSSSPSPRRSQLITIIRTAPKSMTCSTIPSLRQLLTDQQCLMHMKCVTILVIWYTMPSCHITSCLNWSVLLEAHEMCHENYRWFLSVLRFHRIWQCLVAYSFWCFAIIPFNASVLSSIHARIRYVLIYFGTRFMCDLFLMFLCFLF